MDLIGRLAGDERAESLRRRPAGASPGACALRPHAGPVRRALLRNPTDRRATLRGRRQRGQGPHRALKAVATELQRRTSFRLFHNHLTVNAMRSVFDFGTDAFSEVIHRLRLDVFETAARNGRHHIHQQLGVGGSRWPWTVRGVRAGCPGASRVGGRANRLRPAQCPRQRPRGPCRGASRQEHGKLLDPARLKEMLRLFDPAPLHPEDLAIDTSTASPEEAAALIAATCV